jgi:hypothetical protein
VDGRCLVGIPGVPPRLFWLDADAATVLRILRADGLVRLEQIVEEFGDRPGLGDALDTLVMNELVAVH